MPEPHISPSFYACVINVCFLVAFGKVAPFWYVFINVYVVVAWISFDDLTPRTRTGRLAFNIHSRFACRTPKSLRGTHALSIIFASTHTFLNTYCKRRFLVDHTARQISFSDTYSHEHCASGGFPLPLTRSSSACTTIGML